MSVCVYKQIKNINFWKSSMNEIYVFLLFYQLGCRFQMHQNQTLGGKHYRHILKNDQRVRPQKAQSSCHNDRLENDSGRDSRYLAAPGATWEPCPADHPLSFGLCALAEVARWLQLL